MKNIMQCNFSGLFPMFVAISSSEPYFFLIITLVVLMGMFFSYVESNQTAQEISGVIFLLCIGGGLIVYFDIEALLILCSSIWTLLKYDKAENNGLRDFFIFLSSISAAVFIFGIHYPSTTLVVITVIFHYFLVIRDVRLFRSKPSHQNAK